MDSSTLKIFEFLENQQDLFIYLFIFPQKNLKLLALFGQKIIDKVQKWKDLILD